MSADLLATACILTSAFLHASWNALVKHAPEKYETVIFATSYCGIIFVPFAFLVDFPSLTMWTWIAASIAVRLTYQWLSVKSLEANPLTVAYPLARGIAPLIVTGFALLFLGEELPTASLIGISVLVAGIISTLSFKSSDINQTALVYPILTGSFIAFYTLIDSSAVRQTGDAYAYIVWSGIAFAPASLLFATAQRGPALARNCLKTWKLGIPVALISNGAYALVLFAYSLASVAEIAALRETSIIFAALIGYLWLKESLPARKLVSVALIAAGALVIKLF